MCRQKYFWFSSYRWCWRRNVWRKMTSTLIWCHSREILVKMISLNMCCFLIFIHPTGQIRVCKIRFVSATENHGKPCTVCKKLSSSEYQIIWIYSFIFYLGFTAISLILSQSKQVGRAKEKISENQNQNSLLVSFFNEGNYLAISKKNIAFSYVQ